MSTLLEATYSHLPRAATAPFHLGEALFFWVVAAVMVILALGILVCRKAVHSAICMVGVMLCLSMLYIAQGAYFLGVVQVVVYTGAVMTLILFILMMVGVAASDNYLRTKRYLRWGAFVLGTLGAVILAGVFSAAYLPISGQVAATTTAKGETNSNPVQIALSLFTEHVFSMEVVGCLLIIAAIGAMTLTHTDLLRKAFKQPETMQARMLEYDQKGTHPGQRPAPGVYALTNAADTPALEGEHETALAASVPPALRARTASRSLGEATPDTIAKIRADRYGDQTEGLHSLAASQSVAQSGAWGMNGVDAPTGLAAPTTKVIKPGQQATCSENAEVEVANTVNESMGDSGTADTDLKSAPAPATTEEPQK